MHGDERRYQIIGVLGKGGFGTVYKARVLGDRGVSRTVALKVLNDAMHNTEDVAQRLRDDARMLGMIRHRAIVQADGLIRLRGRWTIVMECIDGTDLETLLAAQSIPLGPALEIIGEVAAALHAAHSGTTPEGEPLHLLHRDIKPSNIILTANGTVKLLDFGIARAGSEDRDAQTHSVLYGSRTYMAPERLGYNDLQQGDVYALGAVLYELLTGTSLGRASVRPEPHNAHIDQALTATAETLGELHTEVSTLLRSMLAYEPNERPRADEVERRCHSLRRATPDSPWLSDWSEHAVPPLIATEADLEQDDFAGWVITETATTDIGRDVTEPVTMRTPQPPTKPMAWWGATAGGASLLFVAVLFFAFNAIRDPMNAPYVDSDKAEMVVFRTQQQQCEWIRMNPLRDTSVVLATLDHPCPNGMSVSWNNDMSKAILYPLMVAEPAWEVSINDEKSPRVRKLREAPQGHFVEIGYSFTDQIIGLSIIEDVKSYLFLGSWKIDYAGKQWTLTGPVHGKPMLAESYLLMNKAWLHRETVATDHGELKSPSWRALEMSHDLLGTRTRQVPNAPASVAIEHTDLVPVEERQGAFLVHRTEHGSVAWWSEADTPDQHVMQPVFFQQPEGWTQAPLTLPDDLPVCIQVNAPFALVTGSGSHPNVFDLRTGERIHSDPNVTMAMFWPLNSR